MSDEIKSPVKYWVYLSLLIESSSSELQLKVIIDSKNINVYFFIFGRLIKDMKISKGLLQNSD
jgi:hypothetical protein